VYEADEEEASYPLEVASSKAYDTETEGTLTPTTTNKMDAYSELSLYSDAAAAKFTSQDFLRSDTVSHTESEYFSAVSGFNSESAASSSIWRF
jgi:hypothetical protein